MRKCYNAQVLAVATVNQTIFKGNSSIDVNERRRPGYLNVIRQDLAFIEMTRHNAWKVDRGTEGKSPSIKKRHDDEMNASKCGHRWLELLGRVRGVVVVVLHYHFFRNPISGPTFTGARSSFFARLTNKSRMTYCHEYSPPMNGIQQLRQSVLQQHVSIVVVVVAHPPPQKKKKNKKK